MGFQIIFCNKKWKNASKNINLLDHVIWFIFGGHRYYDPPKLDVGINGSKDGSKIFAKVSPPIWKRFYYRWIYRWI